MLYVIVDKENPEGVTLMKAEDEDSVKTNLRLTPNEIIAGSFTDIELSVLATARFAIIQG